MTICISLSLSLHVCMSVYQTNSSQSILSESQRPPQLLLSETAELQPNLRDGGEHPLGCLRSMPVQSVHLKKHEIGN